MSASYLPKSPSRHQVLSIIAPHESWPKIQPYRTQYVPDIRSGPHLNLLDPFILPEHFDEAAKILRPHLAQLAPFACHLKAAKFGRKVYPKSATLFVEAEFAPADGFQKLLEVLVKVFPQCNDLLVDAPTGRHVPHMTLGKFNDEQELEAALAVIRRTWEDASFTIRECYMLSRIGADPFSILQVIPLGKEPKAPLMGPGNNLGRISA